MMFTSVSLKTKENKAHWNFCYDNVFVIISPLHFDVYNNLS